MNTATAKGAKDRIMDAAELLMAEHGIYGVSLRAITERAGANSASLHYHFSSRRGLIEEIFLRKADAILSRRQETIAELKLKSDPLDVYDIICAMVDPAVDMLRHEKEQGRTFFRFVARLQSDRTNIIQEFELSHYGADELIEMLKRSCPHLSEAELECRNAMAADTIVQSLANADFMAEEWIDDSYHESLDLVSDSLKRFVAGGLMAPARTCVSETNQPSHI